MPPAPRLDHTRGTVINGFLALVPHHWPHVRDIHAACRSVDLAHLDRYTGGVRSLNEEVLRLFETQCGAMLGDLETAASLADAKAWKMLTHTLKGAARGIVPARWPTPQQARKPPIWPIGWRLPGRSSAWAKRQATYTSLSSTSSVEAFALNR